jgi:predicted TPR repeat methyltransferase
MRFMALVDVALFLKSAKTDRAIGRWRADHGERAAFENAYNAFYDPWVAADPRYHYQAKKYAHLMTCLPAGRRFARVLDLGCGLGMLSTQLAAHADQVTGVDIAQAAVDRAAARAGQYANLSFQQADVLDLPASFDGRFDLVVIADTLYYLPPPITPALLEKLAARVAKLLVPGGLCLLANHYFFRIDPASRLSRRIHDTFAGCPHFAVTLQGRRPFYLVTRLVRA